MTDSAASDPEQIERDLERTRARMDDHLSELQERLAPGPLIGEALDYVKGGDRAAFMQGLARGARRNPLPVLMIGAGAIWLIAADRRPRAADRARPATEERWASTDVPAGSFSSGARRPWSGGIDPLVVGGVASLIGAALGSFFQPSVRERRMLGETAVRTRTRARDGAQAFVDRGSQVLNDAIDAGRSSLSRNRRSAPREEDALASERPISPSDGLFAAP